MTKPAKEAEKPSKKTTIKKTKSTRSSVMDEQKNVDEVKEVNANESTSEETTEDFRLKKAKARMDRGNGWATFIFIISVGAYIYSLVKGTGTMAASLPDIIYGGILLYFMFKGNRVASIFFFVQYALASIFLVLMGYEFKAIRAFGLIMLGIGIVGTFSYRNAINQKKLTKSEIVLLIVCSLISLVEILLLCSGILAE